MPRSRARSVSRPAVVAGAIAAFLFSMAGPSLLPGPAGPAGAATGAGAIAAAASDDQAIEKQAVLKRSDLEAGWVATPRSQPEPSTDPACAGIETVNQTLRPRATQSPDFTKSELTMINNSVVVLKTAKEAKRALGPYRESRAAACIEGVVREAFSGPGIASLRVVVAPVTEVPAGADEAAGFTIQVYATTSLTTQQPSQSTVLVNDLLLARVGRAITSFAFLNQAKPLPQQYEAIDTVIGRLERAL